MIAVVTWYCHQRWDYKTVVGLRCSKADKELKQKFRES
jgi:hypothetical protein